MSTAWAGGTAIGGENRDCCLAFALERRHDGQLEDVPITARSPQVKLNASRAVHRRCPKAKVDQLGSVGIH